MYNLKGDKLLRTIFVTAIIAALLVTSIGITNVKALDFSNLEVIDNFGQSVECVIVVVGCDGQGSVGSSGDTIIGSNNGNNDDNNGEGIATLAIIKTVTCTPLGGTPSPDAVCDYALNLSPNASEPSDYQITVAGNHPNPSTFPGSINAVEVTLGAGDYTVSEDIPNFSSLESQLGTTSIVVNTTFSGGCTEINPPSYNSGGTIAAGESQTCSIENNLIISGGSVPSD